MSTNTKFLPPKARKRLYQPPKDLGVGANLALCYVIRTACPNITLVYSCKGSPYGDSAFTFPWDQWLKTDEGTKFCCEHRIEGQMMRRQSVRSNVAIRNKKPAKDGQHYAKMVCTRGFVIFIFKFLYLFKL